MKYTSGAAFRQALEERLRRQSVELGQPLARLRKTAAFERLLARLATPQPAMWILKGGLALQVRMGLRSRTTQDVDLLLRHTTSPANIHAMLVEVGHIEKGDWFVYEVAQPAGDSLRFPIRARLDSRPFETFHLDVGMDDPLVEPPDDLHFPPTVAFAELPPVIFPTYPVSQQIAEKVHDCSRLYLAGESSRIKDWVDIYLLARQSSIQANTLRRALKATFEARATHPLPFTFPALPAVGAKPFQRLASQAGLAVTWEQATEGLKQFLDPILQNHAVQVWHPELWAWQ